MGSTLSCVPDLGGLQGRKSSFGLYIQVSMYIRETEIEKEDICSLCTGLKTFASFEAVGDLSPSTLTVTSDLVNTDINIQDLYDEYIDKTSNVVSITFIFIFISNGGKNALKYFV